MNGLRRRSILRGAASAVALGAAGCLSGGSEEPRYRLSAQNVPGSLADELRWEPRESYQERYRDLMDRLVDDGTLTTEGYALYPVKAFEQRYVERDGTYYRVTAEQTGTVRRDRWTFWFDLIDGNPASDAEVYTSSLGTGDPTDLAAEYGLSERDVRVVEDAAGEIPREGSLHDPEDDPPGRRGHVFVHRDAVETDLLPEPPFTHVAFETNGETRYARAVAERATVELRQYEHTATAVTGSADEYAAHVREQYLEATFDGDGVSEAQREILDTATAGGRHYEEHAPPSDALASVLADLGLDDVAVPESNRVEMSDEVYFEYDGYYTAQLEIFG